jgi:hypothetical protein
MINLKNNRVAVESLVFTADVETLKNSKTVLQKIGFTQQEQKDLESCNFDFETFTDLKTKYSNGDKTVLDDLKSSAPKFLYLKQRRKDADAVAVAVAFDGYVFINKNVDSKLGVGAEATRYKYMAYINGFIDCFLAIDNDLQTFNGVDFVCVESAYDERKTDGAKSNADCLDW